MTTRRRALRRWRKQRRWTLAKAGEVLGISKQRLHQIENGGSMSLTLARRVMQRTGLSFEEVAG